MIDDMPAFLFGPTAHVLHISLEDVEPGIWRRVRIPSTLELADLREVLVRAMGWEGYHLHELDVAGIRFGVNEDDPGMIDEDDIRVEQVLTQVGGTAHWMYDFGDGWNHRITIEAIEAIGDDDHAAVIAGERACPPEDSGGPWGYLDKLRVVADPADEEHELIVGWMPEGFDADAFDLDEANRRLKGH